MFSDLPNSTGDSDGKLGFMQIRFAALMVLDVAFTFCPLDMRVNC